MLYVKKKVSKGKCVGELSIGVTESLSSPAYKEQRFVPVKAWPLTFQARQHTMIGIESTVGRLLNSSGSQEAKREDERLGSRYPFKMHPPMTHQRHTSQSLYQLLIVPSVGWPSLPHTDLWGTFKVHSTTVNKDSYWKNPPPTSALQQAKASFWSRCLMWESLSQAGIWD